MGVVKGSFSIDLVFYFVFSDKYIKSSFFLFNENIIIGRGFILYVYIWKFFGFVVFFCSFKVNSDNIYVFVIMNIIVEGVLYGIYISMVLIFLLD